MDKVGLITIGESPRPDLVELLDLDSSNVVLSGALDFVHQSDFSSDFVWQQGDEDLPLVTRHKTQTVLVKRRKLVLLLQEAIDAMREKVPLVAILCTESFPEISSQIPRIRVDQLITGAVSVLGINGKQKRLGFFVPTSYQVVPGETRWNLISNSKGCELAPNQTDSAIREKCQLVLSQMPSVDLALLDCMAYGSREYEITRKELGCPVVWPAQLLGHYIQSLLWGVKQK